MQRESSNLQRLNFPIQGDSNIFNGVGKKHYGLFEEGFAFKQFASETKINPEKLSQNKYSKIKVRNILNVADIQGATPSVAPEKVKNILKAKLYLKAETQGNDTLDIYANQFKQKTLLPLEESVKLTNNFKR